jgi:LPS export ABC transporter protein LptC/lipopolysaccharide transport protein LptA
MTPAATRKLRQGLVLVVLLLVIAVAFSLRRPPTAAVDAKPTGGTPPSGTTMGGVVLRKFVEGTEKYVVKAKAMTGQEKGQMHLAGVEVTFPYLAQGKRGTGIVTADACVYDPDRQRASFRGNVKVTGGEGLLLETDTLQYQGDAGRARTDDPVKFRRGSLSGESTGAEYRSEEEALDLPKDVRLRVERDGFPPTDIEAGRAEIRRRESAVRFFGAVKVTRGAEYLESDELNLEMSADFEKIDRAVAIEGVVARAGATTLGGGKTPAGGAGSRVLRCRKLDTWFRENGQPRDATAVKNVELVLVPGEEGPREIRRVQGHHLTFRFDEEGRLEVLEGGPNGFLSSAPVRGTQEVLEARRSIKADSFTIRFDPAKGEVATADFKVNVEFAEPGRQAWAQSAVLDEAKATLLLTGGPRVRDEGAGSDLRADAIEIGTRSQTLSARENVRHTVPAQREASSKPSAAPAMFLSRYLDYDSATKTARYRENALLRSGKDELRAPLIMVTERPGGLRHLSASGGIASIMYPRSEAAGKKPPLPVQAQASELEWDEAKGEAVYRGNAVIKQGDIETRSPVATVTMTRQGGGVDKVVAGEPVEVLQGTRRAQGARGTYAVHEEKMVLEGPKVVLEDPRQRTEGRFLTFHAGDDTVLVDGREETRPESIFKREPPRR